MITGLIIGWLIGMAGTVAALLQTFYDDGYKINKYRVKTVLLFSLTWSSISLAVLVVFYLVYFYFTNGGGE